MKFEQVHHYTNGYGVSLIIGEEEFEDDVVKFVVLMRDGNKWEDIEIKLVSFDDINNEMERVKSAQRYNFRGLPVDVAGERGWSVWGTYTNIETVLEWCYSEDDARSRIELMQRDPRFSHLRIKACFFQQEV